MKTKATEEVKLVPLFRVQGGTQPRASKRIISINKEGKLNFSLPTPDAYVYIGTTEHMKYFLKKRAKIVRPLNEVLASGDLNEEVPSSVEIVRMYVPEWYKFLLTSLATTKNKNSPQLVPLLVDKSTPGDSFGICAWWVKILQEITTICDVIEINKYEDILQLFFATMDTTKKNNTRPIDYQQIIKLIKRIDKYSRIPDSIKEGLILREPKFNSLLKEEEIYGSSLR